MNEVAQWIDTGSTIGLVALVIWKFPVILKALTEARAVDATAHAKTLKDIMETHATTLKGIQESHATENAFYQAQAASMASMVETLVKGKTNEKDTDS